MRNNDKQLDARGVLADLISYREELSQVKGNEKSSWSSRVSFWIWVFGIFLFGVGYLALRYEITIPTEYMLIYLIVFLVSLVATVIFTYFNVSRDQEFRSFLKDPVADFLNASDEMLKDEIALYAKLDKYPLDALIQTKNYLTRKKPLIESVSSMLVGVLTKVGLLPAVLAVLVIIAKLNSDNGFSLVSIVAFSLIGIYFVCFKLTEASVKFEEYQSILSDYIEIRERTK